MERSGIALAGAIALVAAGTIPLEEAWGSIDVSTMGPLFGLMLVPEQLHVAGFYSWVSSRVGRLDVPPGGEP